MALSSENKVVNKSSKCEEFINGVFAEKLASIEFDGSTKEKQTIVYRLTLCIVNQLLRY